MDAGVMEQAARRGKCSAHFLPPPLDAAAFPTSMPLLSPAQTTGSTDSKKEKVMIKARSSLKRKFSLVLACITITVLSLTLVFAKGGSGGSGGGQGGGGKHGGNDAGGGGGKGGNGGGGKGGNGGGNLGG